MHKDLTADARRCMGDTAMEANPNNNGSSDWVCPALREAFALVEKYRALPGHRDDVLDQLDLVLSAIDNADFAIGDLA